MKYLAIVFGLFIISVIIAVDTGVGQAFLGWIHSLPMGDKLGHFCLLGILTLLVSLSLKKAYWVYRGLLIPKAALIITVIITLEEFSQILIPYRNFDTADLLANYLGITVFGLIAYFIHRKKLLIPSKGI